MTDHLFTIAEQRVIDRLENGGAYLFGADVRTAQRLQERGFVALQDDGYMRGNSERWSAELTESGREAVRREERRLLLAEAQWGAEMLQATAQGARAAGNFDGANYCEEVAFQALAANIILKGEYRGMLGEP